MLRVSDEVEHFFVLEAPVVRDEVDSAPALRASPEGGVGVLGEHVIALVEERERGDSLLGPEFRRRLDVLVLHLGGDDEQLRVGVADLSLGVIEEFVEVALLALLGEEGPDEMVLSLLAPHLLLQVEDVPAFLLFLQLRVVAEVLVGEEVFAAVRKGSFVEGVMEKLAFLGEFFLEAEDVLTEVFGVNLDVGVVDTFFLDCAVNFQDECDGDMKVLIAFEVLVELVSLFLAADEDDLFSEWAI